jgi:hypothetical protein
VHRSHICRTMEKATLTKVAKEWGVAHSAVGEAADDFPVTVYMKEPCKVGECLHALTPRQRDRHGIIIEELKLALRHSGLPAHSPLLFELICGLEVRYCLIGDNDWTYNLRCDILLAEIVPRRRPGSVVPFELALQKETASGQMCDCGWPKTRSETMFVVDLVTFSSDPWHIYALHAEPDQPFSYIVTDKTKLDAESMREADLERLGHAYALRLLKKILSQQSIQSSRKGTEAAKDEVKENGSKGKEKEKGVVVVAVETAVRNLILLRTLSRTVRKLRTLSRTLRKRGALSMAVRKSKLCQRNHPCRLLHFRLCNSCKMLLTRILTSPMCLLCQYRRPARSLRRSRRPQPAEARRRFPIRGERAAGHWLRSETRIRI